MDRCRARDQSADAPRGPSVAARTREDLGFLLNRIAPFGAAPE